METTAYIVPSSSILRFPGTGDGCRKLPLRQLGDSRVSFSARDNAGILSCEFTDSGHMQYYQSPIMGSGKEMKEIKTEKKMKKLKLIKRLTEDLNFFAQSAHGEIGSRLTSEVNGKMISEATEVLLAELERLRMEQKEQKRKRKEAKFKLVKSKSTIMSESSSSSSSSSSESSECDEGKVVHMRSLRTNSQPQFTENEAEQVRLAESSAETQHEQSDIVTTTSSFNLQNPGCGGNVSGLNGSAGNETSSISAAAVSNPKIEICMGGKCRKMGAPILLEEFERKIGKEGSVVGCKCMGKCKSGPNVRVSNSTSEIQEESSVQTPTNPLYIGVGLEDVGAIVGNLLSNNRIDDRLLAAS